MQIKCVVEIAGEAHRESLHKALELKVRQHNYPCCRMVHISHGITIYFEVYIISHDTVMRYDIKIYHMVYKALELRLRSHDSS